MKKSICLLMCLLMSIVASAQTQHGIVKTRGRMVNGKLVPGQGLADATVKVGDSNDLAMRSNSYVSGYSTLYL